MKTFFFIAAAVMIIGGFLNIEDMPKAGTASMILGAWCLYKGLRSQSKSHELALDEMNDERAEFLRENYNKAITDYNAIENVRRLIGDASLSQNLSSMQRTAGNLLRYLEKNPEKVTVAGKFIDYYQDRTVHLTEKFHELEETGLATPDVIDMKTRIKTAVEGLQTAYEQQFELVLNDRLIDMDAELKVLRQTMTADGVGHRKVNLQKDGSSPSPIPSKKPAVGNNLSIIPPELRNDVLLTKIIQSGLAIFLGGFGAHKFYQRKNFQGVLYFLLCWTIIPSFIGFCEGIRYLCMKMDDFYLEYYEQKFPQK